MTNNNLPQHQTPQEESPQESSNLLDEQWEILSQDWQSQPYAKADVEALLKQTRARTLWAKTLLILNIIATLFFIGMAATMMITGSEDTATMFYFIFAAIFSIVFVYYEVRIRLTVWRQFASSPEQAVDNAIKGLESSLKYIQLTKNFCWVLLPGGCWYAVEMAEQAEKSPWSGVIFVSIFISLIWAITHGFYLKRSKELKHLKQNTQE